MSPVDTAFSWTWTSMDTILECIYWHGTDMDIKFTGTGWTRTKIWLNFRTRPGQKNVHANYCLNNRFKLSDCINQSGDLNGQTNSELIFIYLPIWSNYFLGSSSNYFIRKIKYKKNSFHYTYRAYKFHS